MVIQFTCSQCQAALSFSEAQAGQGVTCLSCGAFLTIPTSNAPPTETPPAQQIIAGDPSPTVSPGGSSTPSLPAPPDVSRFVNNIRELPADYDPRPYERDDYGTEQYERDRERWGSDVAFQPGTNLSGWNLVRIGLGMMYWGMTAVFLTLLGYVVLTVIFLIGTNGRGMDMDGAVMTGILAVVLLGGIGASFIVACVGQCMCCTAPPDSGARGLVMASVVCLFLTVAGIALMFVFFVTLAHNLAMRPGAGNATVAILMGFLFVAGVGVTGHVLFISFLRVVSRYFRNYALTHSAGNYLVLYFIMVVLQFVVSIVPSFAGPDSAPVAGCVSLIVFIMGMVVLIWYLRLIATTRDTIADAMRRSGD